MWATAGDWAVKRLLKAILKRHFKHILATELDFEQLHFSLGKGRLELRDVLVSPEWLAAQAPPGLSIVSGYIGRLALNLAVTSLTCAVHLEDILLTVRPGNGSAQPSGDTWSQQAPAQEQNGADSSLSEPSLGMEDGLRLVATGVETLLQRMTVTLARLSIRVEATAGSSAATAACRLTCAQLNYGSMPAQTLQEQQQQQQDCHSTSTARRLSFSGLCLVAEEGAPPLLAPLNGQVDVSISWLLGQQPSVSVGASVEGVQLQLRPPDVVALLQLAQNFTVPATQPQHLAPPPPAKQGSPRSFFVRQPSTSTSSFLEDLMLPGCEGLVQEALQESLASPSSEEDEFFYANSLLGSLQQAFSSAMAGSFVSGSAPALSSSTIIGDTLDLGSSDIFAMHDLAASIRQVGAVHCKLWDVTVSVPSLTLSLLYPAVTEADSRHSIYAPRLVVEATSLFAGMHSESTVGIAGLQRELNGSLNLSVGRLEVAEHLPFPTSSTSSSATAGVTSASGWVPAEEMAQVPAVLPSAKVVQWSLPTFAGDYPLPDEGTATLGIADTLAQLSDLSQATVYQSTTEASMLRHTINCQGISTTLPRVQVVPVLHCGSQAHAALVLHCNRGTAAGGHVGAPDVEVALMLQPVSIWCTLPLVAHLQSFVLAVTSLLGPIAPGLGTAAEQGSGNTGKAAVEAAIGAILQEQEGTMAQRGAILNHPGADGAASIPLSLRLSVYLPAACIIIAVPEAILDDSLPQCPPNYFALDVRSSDHHLLANVFAQLASYTPQDQPQVMAASLRDFGVQPTVVLQQGGSFRHDAHDVMRSLAVAEKSWTCAVRIGSCAAHAVAVSGAQSQMGGSLIGSEFLVAQVASMSGPPAPAPHCLSIDACWRQHANGLPPANVLDSLWASAELEPGGQLERRQQVTADARLVVAVTGFAPLALTLDRGILGGASSLADGLLELSTAPPLDTTTQAALVLDFEVQCVLTVPRGPPISIAARSVSAVACSGLSCVPGSSSLAVAVGGLELARAQDWGPASLLLHAPGRQLADGRRPPALHLFAVLRPTGDACVLCNNGRYVLPCRGRVAVSATGLTAVLDESGQLGWLADLRDLSASLDSSSHFPVPALRQQDGTPLPSPPPTLLDWAVSLSRSSIRYEPQDTSLVAAVLTAASFAWHSKSEGQGRCIEARRLALHLAAPANNADSGLGGTSCRMSSQSEGCSTGGLERSASSAVNVAGFHQIMAEAVFTMQMPGAQLHVEPHLQQAPAMSEITITNKDLSIALSRQTFLLLQRLVRQLSARSSVASTTNSSGCRGMEVSQPNTAADRACMAGSSVLKGKTLNVMQGVVQSAFASPPRTVEHPQEASAFLDGGWYDPHQDGSDHPYTMSPAGSPPAMVEGFYEGFANGRPGVTQKQQGMWHDGASGADMGADLLEGYVTLAAPGQDEESSSFGSADYDCRTLPSNHAVPTRRITLRDISITVTLADTFATVLLPEDDRQGDAGVAGSSFGSPHAERRYDHMAAPRAASDGGSSGGEEEMVPLSAQVQARLEGVCLQMDTFAEQQAALEGGGLSEAPVPSHRYALVVRNLEVRDSFQPRQGGGAGSATAAATGWSELRRMLGYHASVHRVRGGKTNLMQFVVEAVRSEPTAELEYRAQAQLLPLLLHLDQAALAFLQHFFAPDAEVAKSRGTNLGRSRAASEPAAAGDMFFQKCEVQPFTLSINYRPHRVDLTALSSGQLSEVLNLVPWGGVSLQFRHLRLFGMQGLAGVGTSVASAYIEDIARFQAHRFVGGIAPIKSICKVSSAAAQLLAIPRQQLSTHTHGGGSGLSLTVLVEEDFRRQMQRGLASFVRAVALEALNLGATMAAGAEVALAGESSTSHTAGVKKALRQASTQLRSSSSGPRAAASAAATALRTALLGVRNTLDRDHAIERRLNS